MHVIQPKRLHWNLQEIPSLEWRLRWYFILASGIRIYSTWSPNVYPSFSQTMKQYESSIIAIGIEGEHIELQLTETFIECEKSEFVKLEYIGMYATSGTSNDVTGISIIARDNIKITAFVNGYIHIEDSHKEGLINVS